MEKMAVAREKAAFQAQLDEALDNAEAMAKKLKEEREANAKKLTEQLEAAQSKAKAAMEAQAKKLEDELEIAWEHYKELQKEGKDQEMHAGLVCVHAFMYVYI